MASGRKSLKKIISRSKARQRIGQGMASRGNGSWQVRYLSLVRGAQHGLKTAALQPKTGAPPEAGGRAKPMAENPVALRKAGVGMGAIS